MASAELYDSGMGEVGPTPGAVPAHLFVRIPAHLYDRLLVTQAELSDRYSCTITLSVLVAMVLECVDAKQVEAAFDAIREVKRGWRIPATVNTCARQILQRAGGRVSEGASC